MGDGGEWIGSIEFATGWAGGMPSSGEAISSGSMAISLASTEHGAEIVEKGLAFVAPVQPSKIMAIGLNYKDHAAEMNKKLPGRAAGVHEARRAP